MLFNSSVFLFHFLPLVVGLYYVLLRWAGLIPAQLSLLLASLYFYGADKPALLLLLAGSVLVNYGLSRLLCQRARPLLLGLGISANLLLLGVYKYTDFLIGNLNAALGTQLPLTEIGLPLGISFLTFHQISYLVDVQRGVTRPASLWRFTLYMAFFPHLIAGPIVRHAELMPQLQKAPAPDWLRHLAVGLTVFIIGLAKKVLIADPLALYADPVFASAEAGQPLAFATAWLAALAYMFQIYFDFSGYSDMAIGLARMFGLRLPLNFIAPYRATSIIEFWRRWHVTLSRFLRDYLYFALGGNRQGQARRWLNLLLVMLLGGLWHGAGWTFAAWGLLHGLYLVINHAWQAAMKNRWPQRRKLALWRISSWALCMLAVLVAWVFFRAHSFAGAAHLLQAMASLPSGEDYYILRRAHGVLTTLGLAAALVLLAPTAAQLLARYRPAMPPVPPAWQWCGYRLLWRPTPLWGAALALLFFAVMTQISQPSAFIYFRF